MDNIKEETTVVDKAQIKELTISPLSINFLNETGGWTRFLAIIGFVFVGLMVVVAIFAGTLLSNMPGGDAMPLGGAVLSIIYLLMAALYFFPILYLYKFGKQIKEALSSKENRTLEQAFENLKSHYKFIGIMMIVLLGSYLIMGVIGGAAYLFFA